jgi:nitrite reductase/ring-hydroxylating ferredoxin subunit
VNPTAIPVLDEDALLPGASRCVRIAGRPLLLVRSAEDGGVVALEALCPHAGGDLCQGQITGGTITCPLHGAQFEVASGALRRGPAEIGLAAAAAQIAGGWIVVDPTLLEAPVPRDR